MQKNGYWPKNRQLIEIYNFDPNLMKVGENYLSHVYVKLPKCQEDRMKIEEFYY